MVFLKEFFEKFDFEIKTADDKESMQNYPVGKELHTSTLHNKIRVMDMTMEFEYFIGMLLNLKVPRKKCI